MTPIEQVKPPTPGNWTRRPDGRVKRGGPDAGKERRPADRGADKGRAGRGPGPEPDGREHIVDELA